LISITEIFIFYYAVKIQLAQPWIEKADKRLTSYRLFSYYMDFSPFIFSTIRASGARFGCE
jgi:hypothetical protein